MHSISPARTAIGLDVEGEDESGKILDAGNACHGIAGPISQRNASGLVTVFFASKLNSANARCFSGGVLSEGSSL